MTQDHKAFPKIAKLTSDMAFYNGGYAARRFQGMADPEEDMMRLLDECLGAEGVYFDDLKALDTWLGTLTEEEFMMAAGEAEEGEMQALLAKAPVMSEGTAAEFIDTVYEHCI